MDRFMFWKIFRLMLVLCISLEILFPQTVFSLLSFPGAEGFGSTTVGGRGGTVYIVDTLSDNPADGMTFREACSALGARIIVFRVSGTINLASILEVNNPYLTIAGQTSPGGIAISGGMFQLTTHDVIITHMRFRMGSGVCDTGDCDTQGDAFRIMGTEDDPAYNILVDHCSIAWGCDETVDISSWYGDTYNVTFSNCLIGQGLDDPAPEDHHALGVLISGAHTVSRPLTITLHHNFIAHFRYRFPQIQSANVDLYNNVMYNYDSFSTMIDRDRPEDPEAYLNTRHNYYKEGISTGYGNTCVDAPNKSIGVIWDYDGTNYAMTGTPTPLIYSLGNVGCASIGDTTGKFASGYWGNGWPFLASGWISGAVIAAATNGDATVTTMDATYAGSIVSNAGANRIANSGSPSTQSDSLDTTLKNSWTTPGSVSWLTDMHYPTGWPAYTNTTPATDSDSDGMDDAWETTMGYTVGSNDANTSTVSGYSRLETYLHYLGGYSVVNTASTVTGLAITGGSVQ